jgi:hypothetical protein
MLASLLIIAFSLVLFIYWFRYSCILLLRNRAEQPAAIESDRFNCAYVRQGLQTGMELDPLQLSLENDFKILTYLMEHAASLELEQLECKLLLLDYKLMRGWYRVTKSAAPQQARKALSEMAEILCVLVGQIGQQAGVQNEV